MVYQRNPVSGLPVEPPYRQKEVIRQNRIRIYQKYEPGWIFYGNIWSIVLIYRIIILIYCFISIKSDFDKRFFNNDENVCLWLIPGISRLRLLRQNVRKFIFHHGDYGFSRSTKPRQRRFTSPQPPARDMPLHNPAPGDPPLPNPSPRWEGL